MFLKCFLRTSSLMWEPSLLGDYCRALGTAFRAAKLRSHGG